MKKTEQITKDILSSLGQSSNPMGILVEGYLDAKIREIVKDHLVQFQFYLQEECLITDHDWSFEDEVNKFLNR